MVEEEAEALVEDCEEVLEGTEEVMELPGFAEPELEDAVADADPDLDVEVVKPLDRLEPPEDAEDDPEPEEEPEPVDDLRLQALADEA